MAASFGIMFTVWMLFMLFLVMRESWGDLPRFNLGESALDNEGCAGCGYIGPIYRDGCWCD